MGTMRWVGLGFVVACAAPAAAQPAGGAPRVTAFEGARVLTGDEMPPIEDAVFVVAGERFLAVGPRGSVAVPAGAARVDLKGKTVMPGKVDVHGHIGFQHAADGTMAKEYYTRANLIDHLERFAYYGVSAVVGVGDLVDRSDLRGGRTGFGNVPAVVRDEVIPGAALFRTAGPGIAWPGAGPQGHPSRTDVPYPVTTVAEAQAAVADYARMRPTFVKLWIDDRDGTMMTLPPPVYRAAIDAAHAAGLPVAVHNVTLANAKELVRAGVEGWLHLPVRGGEVPDEELLALVRARSAARVPAMWFHPNVGTAATSRDDWSDPLLTDTVSPELIERYWGEALATRTPAVLATARENLRRLGETTVLPLRRAGMKIVFGSDTGQSRFFMGWMGQLELENWVRLGLTPAEAITAATRDSAAAVGLDTGLIAAGRRADFVVLDANPLADIANSRRISAVYLRGMAVDRAALRAKWRGPSGGGSRQP